MSTRRARQDAGARASCTLSWGAAASGQRESAELPSRAARKLRTRALPRPRGEFSWWATRRLIRADGQPAIHRGRFLKYRPCLAQHLGLVGSIFRWGASTAWQPSRIPPADICRSTTTDNGTLRTPSLTRRLPRRVSSANDKAATSAAPATAALGEGSSVVSNWSSGR